MTWYRMKREEDWVLLCVRVLGLYPTSLQTSIYYGLDSLYLYDISMCRELHGTRHWDQLILKRLYYHFNGKLTVKGAYHIQGRFVDDVPNDILDRRSKYETTICCMDLCQTDCHQRLKQVCESQVRVFRHSVSVSSRLICRAGPIQGIQRQITGRRHCVAGQTRYQFRGSDRSDAPQEVNRMRQIAGAVAQPRQRASLASFSQDPCTCTSRLHLTLTRLDLFRNVFTICA